MRTILCLFLMLCFAAPATAGAGRFAVALSATPVLNTPDFATVFAGKLRLDPCQGVRPIEFIALPGTLFRVEGEEKKGGRLVYRVTSNDYPYPSHTGYYVDPRFLRGVDAPRERRPTLPPLKEVQRRLERSMGLPYVWGGNAPEGVPLLSKLYPGSPSLAGVDCSGLLYQATDGYTPRNTSTLTGYGAAVPVAGLDADQIAKRLLPLDLLVWKGHVMMVLDGERVIESRMGCSGGSGVQAAKITEALRRLLKTREPLDAWVPDREDRRGFVVRRWYPR